MTYKTKQKDMILDTLKTNQDKWLSLNDIEELLKDKGVSYVTVYRYIKDLLSSNKIIKNYKENSYKLRQNDNILVHCKSCETDVTVEKNIVTEQIGLSDIDLDSCYISGVCKGCSK